MLPSSPTLLWPFTCRWAPPYAPPRWRQPWPSFITSGQCQLRGGRQSRRERSSSFGRPPFTRCPSQRCRECPSFGALYSSWRKALSKTVASTTLTRPAPTGGVGETPPGMSHPPLIPSCCKPSFPWGVCSSCPLVWVHVGGFPPQAPRLPPAALSLRPPHGAAG